MSLVMYFFRAGNVFLSLQVHIYGYMTSHCGMIFLMCVFSGYILRNYYLTLFMQLLYNWP